MTTADLVILLAVAAAAIGAILAIRRNRKAGKGCGRNCAGCQMNCEKKADA